MTIDDMQQGVSKTHNPVIARLFRELKLRFIFPLAKPMEIAAAQPKTQSADPVDRFLQALGGIGDLPRFSPASSIKIAGTTLEAIFEN